jgi:hypothetical protein
MQKPAPTDYFQRRAEEERAAADSAADKRAAESHLSLAARYDAKAKGSPVRELKVDDTDEGGILPKEFRILP